MTVATTQISETWTGDASSVTFPIPFPFLDRAHLIVWKEDTLGVQTSMTIDSATGEGDPSGGSITLTAPVGVGYTLHVRRQTPRTQETDYVPHDPFPADSHERALDKLTMIVQELLASGSIDIDINYLGDLIGDSSTIIWTRSPDGTKLIGSVVPGAGDTYKTKVNADDATPGFLEQKLADTTDTQFSPTEDGSQLDNIVYQLTGLGTRLNRVKDAGFDFEIGPFPQSSTSGGRGICFGRRFVAGVEVDSWVAQGNNGKLYWTSNNDASRWKITTEDDSVYSAYPSARTYYGWSCIQFVYVAGAHNCFCWVMGSGDLPQTIVFIEHKPENYNADGTFKTSALNSVTYGPTLGPYSANDIMQVDTTGGIFIAGDDTRVGYTTDLATFQLAVTADHNVGGFGFDGETTVQVIERDTGVIWRSAALGAPGTFSKVATFYLDDVPVSNFPMPQPGGTAAQWGSMFSMYGQWLSINFHYAAGGIGFIYSDDGIYWYSSRDEATPFYDANNDGLRWFATNAVPNSGSPIFQLIVSMIPAHRRMSLEKGAVVSGPMILRELPNAPLLGTDHRGRMLETLLGDSTTIVWSRSPDGKTLIPSTTISIPEDAMLVGTDGKVLVDRDIAHIRAIFNDADIITQVDHGFVGGDCVYQIQSITPSLRVFAKAQADSIDTLCRFIVVEIIDEDTFVIANSRGWYLPGIDAGPMWLSQDSAGEYTSTEPTTGLKQYLGWSDGNSLHLDISLNIISDAVPLTAPPHGFAIDVVDPVA